jgi:RNA polymerase sigma factor (sigma-70 family)
MIPSIGKQKIKYKDHLNIKFENMDFYLDLAKKIISKMAPTFFNGLAKEMLKNEDAVSFVASSIMMGDWRWKNNEDNDTSKTYKTLYSYRNQCGIWAIKTYVTKKYKQNNNKKKIKITHSINYSDDDISLESLLPDNSQKNPIEILIDKEKHSNMSVDIKNLLDMANISDKQKNYIRLYYYENMTLEQVGNNYGVTREAVRQSIKSAIKKIKEICV